MYVYLQSEKTWQDMPGLWTVGFYDPAGKWHAESDHLSEERAAERVAWRLGLAVAALRR